MYAICHYLKNRSCFWTRCSSTLTLFRNSTCLSPSFFNADANIESSISKSGKSNRSRFQKFVHWLCCLNLFDPIHGDLRIGCSQTNLNPGVDFPALNVHGTKKFPKIQFLKKEFSDNPPHHCENKFHQYDSTCHFYCGSGMKELTFSTILFSFNSLFSLLFR